MGRRRVEGVEKVGDERYWQWGYEEIFSLSIWRIESLEKIGAERVNHLSYHPFVSLNSRCPVVVAPLVALTFMSHLNLQ